MSIILKQSAKLYVVLLHALYVFPEYVQNIQNKLLLHAIQNIARHRVGTSWVRGTPALQILHEK